MSELSILFCFMIAIYLFKDKKRRINKEYTDGYRRLFLPLTLVALLFGSVTADTLERSTGDKYDTAEEKLSSHTTNTSSGDLELVYDSGKQAVGIRFPDITVPNGATITRAYIQFHADGSTTNEPVNLTIKGENSDDAASFSSETSNVTSRATTSSTVYWDNIPPWSNDNEAGSAQRTPELKSIVQEIVNRSGWTSGNAMAFIITEHGDNGYNLRRAETHHGDDESPKLFIEYVIGSSDCHGCNCSLDKEPDNDTSPGVAITDLDNTSNDVSTCISGSSENDDYDYYHFTVMTAGQLDITTSSPNDHDYHMEIVSDKQGTLLNEDTEKNRVLSYTLTAGEKITIMFKESGDDLDEYQANFTFTKSDTSCNGCDCSLDKEPDNNTAPGVLIPDLDGVDRNVTTCFSGESENDDKDYYYFTTAASGVVNIKTSSPNGHEYHLEILSNKQGVLLPYDTDENRDLNYTLSPDERLTFFFKETGDDVDEYQAIITFIENEYVESAEDICYVGEPEADGACFEVGGIGGGFNCTKTITLKSLNDISDVKAIVDASSLASGSLFDDCGVDGVSGKDKSREEDGACYEDDDINIGPVALFDNGIQYNVTSNMEKDATHSIYDQAMFDISFFKTDNLYATYIKNGQKYRGKVKACRDGYCANISRGDRDFTIRNPQDTRNIYGNYTIIGNQNLCTDKNNDGTCADDPKTTSNSYPSLYVDIDEDDTTVNSSSSTLNIPEGARVVWAGLYWQGTIHNSNHDDNPVDEDFGRNDLWVEGNKIVGATNIDSYHQQIDLQAENNGYYAYNACKVKLKVPGRDYVEVSADQLDFDVLGYGAFVDITDKIDATNPNGVYTIADIKSQTGIESDHGNYAAWSLVVIYEKDDDKFRNISVFDGYVTVTSEYTGELKMSGFLTKKTPPVTSKLAFFTLDGDGGKNSLLVDDQKISNENHPADRFFNSTISSEIVRNPDYPSARVDLDYIELVDILRPSQTSAVIKPRSDGDRYTGSYFIMSAELRQVDICYDYTYGQSGAYRTAPSIKPAIIKGSFNSSPIDVKLYFKNQENSDISIKNLYVNIDPIEDHTTYKSDSTYVTPPRGHMTFLPDSERDTGPSHDNNISIGDLSSLDYFYVYYSLSHSEADINTKINATLHFDLVVDIDGETITLGNSQANIQTMEPCQSANVYEPVPGYFNIVHSAYKKDDANYYFNLPTQVVGRYLSDKFLVESMDPDDLNKTITGVKEKNVTVEMLDVSGFHYSTATCTDENATVVSTHSILVLFDNDDTQFTVPLDKDKMQEYGFFDKAVQNAAFRIGYYLDENATQRVYTCSRDNFAIRPEAFHMHLVDNNQSNGVISIPEGSATQNIVAGYEYDIDVNATYFESNARALGYTKSFSGISSSDSYGLKWASAKSTSVCNDISDKDQNLSFMDGNATGTISIDQVGEYTLLLRDRTWTSVDWNLSYMAHHVEGYFKSGRDCKEDSTIIGNESDTDHINGCDISSDYSSSSRSYYDYHLEIFPYEFKLDLTSHTPEEDKDFVYMASILDLNSNDKNMSYFFKGVIEPIGQNGNSLSNFTTDCYAKTLDINTSNDYNGSKKLVYELYLQDDPNVESNGSIDRYDSKRAVATKFFPKENNGSAKVLLRYNIERSKNKALNPVKVVFGKLDASFQTTPSHMYANSSDIYKVTGKKSFNDSIYFYYAKAHVAKSVIEGNEGEVTGHYEVFCYGTDENGNTCHEDYLQDGEASENSDDPRWWINSKHTVSYGKMKDISQKRTPAVVSVTREPTGNANDIIGLKYNESKGYPYRATMKMVPNDWLIYNKYNADADHNEFEVEFHKEGSKWIGSGETNTSSTTEKYGHKDRKLTW